MLLAPAMSAAQSTELPPELADLTTTGVTIDLLASETLTASGFGTVLLLERLVPNPAADQVVNTLDPELWYVETGTLVYTDGSGQQQTVGEGEQTVIAGGSSIPYRIEGEGCPSVLRLALTAAYGMEVSSGLEGPVLGGEEAGCPAAGTLFKSVSDLDIQPSSVLAFISRMTFPAADFPPGSTYSGPVGYATESGALGVTVASAANVVVLPGSSVVVSGGEPHGVGGFGGAPATALVAGLLATDAAAPPTPTPIPTVASGVQGSTYRSPTYGYSLGWDGTWTVVAESSAEGSDLLQLSNGVSNVYFQSYGNYTGDAVGCVASIAAQFPNNPGWSEVEPMRTAGGDPIAGGDGDRSYAAYTFNYTVDSTTTAYVEYLECRIVVPGESVLVISQVVTADAYPSQIEPMRVLLTGLTIP
jgi:hypothetical protein